MTLFGRLKGVRCACYRMCAAPKVCTMRRGEEKAAVGKAADRRAREERKEERQERRGSGGQALPANQRRAPGLQKTEPRSPGLGGARSRVWALGGREQLCREHWKVPSLLLIH